MPTWAVASAIASYSPGAHRIEVVNAELPKLMLIFMELLHFCGNGLSEPLHKRYIPSLGQSGSHREGGAVLEIEIGIVVVSHWF